MRKYFLTLLVLVGSLLLCAAAPEPFIWQAEVMQLPNKRFKISAVCKIAEHSYLYCNSTRVTVRFADGKVQEIKSPPGTADAAGDLIYKSGIARWGMFTEQKPLSVTADFQGCISGKGTGEDVCLLPQTLTIWGEQLSNQPPAGGKASALPSELATALQRFQYAETVSGILDAENLEKFVQQKKAALPAETAGNIPAEEKGFWAILLLVILGGLGLNLTPCVLPMIPINLAIIGADSAAGGRWHGFRRGAAYGIGITLTYGVLGILAVLTGSRFGELNSSSIFNWIIAAVFVLLALGMFGVYELDIARVTNIFRRSGQPRQKRQLPPEIAAVFMGMASALLAGACVAPVVITVIVLAAKFSAGGNHWGLLLPFALGLAMALPWPLLGAGLAVLPKPGAWMVKVKYAFGILILLMAAYYAYLGWTLRSGAFDQQREIVRLTGQLNTAADQQKNVLIDCWASWCKNCHALDKMLSSPAGKAVLERNNIQLIKFQAEKLNDPAVKALLDRYKLPGLPSLILLKGSKER